MPRQRGRENVKPIAHYQNCGLPCGVRPVVWVDIAAVNHGGDSDSTGAVTGNLLGAYLGLERIENKWLEKLEHKDLIMEMADDLALGVSTEAETERMAEWQKKYVEIKMI